VLVFWFRLVPKWFPKWFPIRRKPAENVGMAKVQSEIAQRSFD
jgi:hypothetical protein